MLKTRKNNTILVIFTVFIFSESLPAQENVNLHNMAYIGAGPTSNSNDENNDIPWSIGVMYGSIDTNLVWGLDIAGEGTLLDSTDGFNNDLSQGLSFNFLVGRDNSRTSDGRLAEKQTISSMQVFGVWNYILGNNVRLFTAKALEKSSALIIPKATLDKKLLTLDPFLRLLFRQALTHNENFGSP